MFQLVLTRDLLCLPKSDLLLTEISFSRGGGGGQILSFKTLPQLKREAQRKLVEKLSLNVYPVPGLWKYCT